MVPLGLAETTSVPTVTSEKMQSACMRALQRRRYRVLHESPGNITAYLQHRSREITIRVEYSERAFSIHYVNSSGLAAEIRNNQQMISSRYFRYTRALSRTIRQELRRPQYSEYNEYSDYNEYSASQVTPADPATTIRPHDLAQPIVLSGDFSGPRGPSPVSEFCTGSWPEFAQHELVVVEELPFLLIDVQTGGIPTLALVSSDGHVWCDGERSMTGISMPVSLPPGRYELFVGSHTGAAFTYDLHLSRD